MSDVKIPEGFIRLTTSVTAAEEPVLVRVGSIELVRGSAYGTYLQTQGGGHYVLESFEEVAAALSQPNDEGEGK